MVAPPAVVAVTNVDLKMSDLSEAGMDWNDLLLIHEQFAPVSTRACRVTWECRTLTSIWVLLDIGITGHTCGGMGTGLFKDTGAGDIGTWSGWGKVDDWGTFKRLLPWAPFNGTSARLKGTVSCFGKAGKLWQNGQPNHTDGMYRVSLALRFAGVVCEAGRC